MIKNNQGAAFLLVILLTSIVIIMLFVSMKYFNTDLSDSIDKEEGQSIIERTKELQEDINNQTEQVNKDISEM